MSKIKNGIDVMVSKIPEITLAFWIMKICATTLGETAGDLMSMTLNVGYEISSLILISIFLISLCAQLFFSKKYNPIIYWLVILSTSTAGTTISDFMDRTLGLGYAKGSMILISLLLITLAAWKLIEGSIPVNNIKSRSGELFYWIAILFSNTLGTAFGDFLADSSGLGFLGGAVLVSTSILFIYLLYKYTNVNRIILFWFAFILTRPLGATVGDLLTKTTAKGGLGFGTIGSSLVLLAILVALIIVNIRKENRKYLRAL